MKNRLFFFSVCCLLCLCAAAPVRAGELEKALGGKENVARENTEYIEKEYARMLQDCQQFDAEMKKDCIGRTESWRKNELQKVEELKKFLSK